MPPELARSFSQLSADVIRLSARWDLYRQLFSLGPLRVQLLERTAASFFMVLNFVLLDDIVLGMCRLFDPPRSGSNDNLVLKVLLEHLEEVAPELEQEMSRRLAPMVAKVKPLRAARHKRIAHRDRALALGLEPEGYLPSFSRPMVGELLGEVQAFLNAIESHFDHRTIAYDHIVNPDGADALVQHLVQAVEFERRLKLGQIPWDWRRDSEFRDA